MNPPTVYSNMFTTNSSFFFSGHYIESWKTIDIVRNFLQHAIDNGLFQCFDPNLPDSGPGETLIKKAQSYLRPRVGRDADNLGFRRPVGWDVYAFYDADDLGPNHHDLTGMVHNYYFDDFGVDHSPTFPHRRLGFDTFESLYRSALERSKSLGLDPVFFHRISIFSCLVQQKSTDFDRFLLSMNSRYEQIRKRIPFFDVKNTCNHCLWTFKSPDDLTSHLDSHPDCVQWTVHHT